MVSHLLGEVRDHSLTKAAPETFLLHLHNADLTIHEVALSKGDPNDLDFRRLDCLYICLHAIKNWFDIFLALPAADYVGVSMVQFTQLAHCMIALFRLSTFDWPDWDRNLVRNYANLSMILDQLVAKFAQVKVTAGLDKGVLDEKDIFFITSRTFNHIKTWWDSKLAAEAMGSDTTAVDETMGEVPMDFLDDAWFQDVLGTGHYRFEPFSQ